MGNTLSDFSSNGTTPPPFWTTGYNPLIWENRCKGKAIFALDLEGLKFS